MAILKHKTNKNMDYGTAMDYLLFQHDEYTMKPILDEQGRKQLRDEFYVDGINCDPYHFDADCNAVNKKFHKNYRYDEIKAHHYVLSFDPSDKTERGLTGKKAQELGLEFARKNFLGHQMLVGDRFKSCPKCRKSNSVKMTGWISILISFYILYFIPSGK